MTTRTAPRQRSPLQRLVDDLEPDTSFDAADLGTAFGMECSLAEQEAAEDFMPSEFTDN